ncbi:phage terminase large subunit [Sporosarcina sp. P7]|uniref:phage terminase large subunit n=1 Tax=Sporosarcina sp. P7 TaxID=2048244 RepID=UPI0035162E68
MDRPTADDNLFLPDSYIEQLEEMKEYDPDLHRIALKVFLALMEIVYYRNSKLCKRYRQS